MDNVSSERPISPNDQMTHDEQESARETKSHELCMATDYQPCQSENSKKELSYDWEMDEVLQMAKAFRISSDEEGSDGYTSDDFLVPDPSISGIMEGTSYTSSSKATTSVEENYIMDDMSSLTNISDIKLSNAPQRHEFGKERVEREGNIYDKLYNACLKGQVSIVKDILETQSGTLEPDEYGQTPLYAACLGNHLDIIKLLISAGYDVNHQDNEGETPLHWTFENHDPDFAKILITEFCADTEVRDAQNWTPLHTAIDRGYFNYSHDLICNFFHQDVGTEVIWIQLHAACFEGRTRDVQVLLDANTDVNHVSSAGYTPLHIAVTKNNTDLVTLLVDQNANVNSMTSIRQTPLHIAAENCNDFIMQKLLKMKADVNLKNELGNTSLHLSVKLNQIEKPKKAGAGAGAGDIIFQTCSIQTLEALIGYGAEVNAVNNRCQTALWFACCDGQDEFVKILLHAGANPNITDKHGDSSLHSAICGYCRKDTLQELIDHGADVNAAANNGDTAISLASCRAQREIVTLFLIAKADPNIANADGDACLHRAVNSGCSEEILQDLILYGGDVNAVNKKGRTALLLSCFFRQMDSVRVLLGAGADPTISDEEGFSCLHAAVDGRCSKGTLQALIDHGAHIDAKRKDGTTALLSACRTGQSESVMFLLDSGADVKLRKPDSNTCLYLAVQGHCSKDTLQKIIDQGSNVNALNRRGETALIRACYNAQMESVKVLLENGADPNIYDVLGNSSLLAAILANCTNETLKDIIAYKADLGAQNKTGRTALLAACCYRQQEAVQILLKAGSNPNITDKHGNTCLIATVYYNGSRKVIRSLIKHGANVNAIVKYNQTALMIACHKKYADFIHVLLKAGSDTNIVDEDSWTCLMYAVNSHCSNEILQAITDHGVDVNAKDKDNQTALMIACGIRHVDAIHVLLKAGSDTNIVDKNIWTCLMSVVESQCSNEVLQAIIDHGADANATDKNNRTALMIACQKKHVDAIHVLLKAGSDTNIVHKDGDTCLMVAVADNCSDEVLQALIDHGVNVNAQNSLNCTALMTACDDKHADAIHVLLKAGADANIVHKSGLTCLMAAVSSHCINEVLQAIIDHGANVNATDQTNRTALMKACQEKHVDSIHVLLKAGADTNIAHMDGWTCLMCAVDSHCSYEMLQEIIDHGADVNVTNKYNRTALMIACERRHEDAIHVLLKAGSDTNIAHTFGRTCLMVAVANNCSDEVLQAIIDHGADVNATNRNNHTALMLACGKRHANAIHVLLNAGSDTNIAHKDGWTCLMVAVDSHCSYEMVQEIIDHGADVNATNRNNHTALMLACGKGHVDAIHILLKAGSDTNIAHKDGWTCLMVAVDSHCSYEMVQEIIDHGADVNATNRNNHTALMLACGKRHVDAIHILLKAGSDTNIAHKDGWTCLMVAVDSHCSYEMVQEIIDHGADVNVTNKYNRTALTIACEKRHVDAIHVLRKAGADTNIVEKYGGTCLMRAVKSHCNCGELRAIIDHGVNVNAQNSLNCTALMIACDEKHADAIHVLLKAGCDTNIVHKSGWTCLMYAVSSHCSNEVLQAIIDHGADVNATNKNNLTALMIACDKRYADAIHVLLKAGSDTNIVHKKGWTCLMYAVSSYCSNEVLQAIIDRGANVNARNNMNVTPLKMAYNNGNVDALNVLLSARAYLNVATRSIRSSLLARVRKVFR